MVQIRKQLAKVPVSLGDKIAWVSFWVWLGSVAGWGLHEWSAPLVCWGPA